MKIKLGCDGCIRRKTMFCPPSIECMSLDDLPYYLDKTSALEEIERLQTKIEQLRTQLNTCENIIKEVRELVENGVDFKCITFRKVDEDTWKVILANHIKEDFLEILDKDITKKSDYNYGKVEEDKE